MTIATMKKNGDNSDAVGPGDAFRDTINKIQLNRLSFLISFSSLYPFN